MFGKDSSISRARKFKKVSASHKLSERMNLFGQRSRYYSTGNYLFFSYLPVQAGRGIETHVCSNRLVNTIATK